MQVAQSPLKIQCGRQRFLSESSPKPLDCELGTAPTPPPFDINAYLFRLCTVQFRPQSSEYGLIVCMLFLFLIRRYNYLLKCFAVRVGVIVLSKPILLESLWNLMHVLAQKSFFYFAVVCCHSHEIVDNSVFFASQINLVCFALTVISIPF